MHWLPNQIKELKKLKEIYPKQMDLSKEIGMNRQRLCRIYNEHEFFTVAQARQIEVLTNKKIDGSKLINPKHNYYYQE